MGNRANFGFTDSENVVYLYGHWAGHEMFARLAKALDRVVKAGRESDSMYGTRICISDMVDDHNSDLGWGISVNVVGDNEHKIPIVDWQNDRVSLVEPAELGTMNDVGELITYWTIKDFVRKFSK